MPRRHRSELYSTNQIGPGDDIEARAPRPVDADGNESAPEMRGRCSCRRASTPRRLSDPRSSTRGDRSVNGPKRRRKQLAQPHVAAEAHTNDAAPPSLPSSTPAKPPAPAATNRSTPGRNDIRPRRHPRRLSRCQPRHMRFSDGANKTNARRPPDPYIERPYRWSRRFYDDPPIGTIVYGDEQVISLGNGEWQPLDDTCARCGLRIEPGQPRDLGHDDVDRRRYVGPEHARSVDCPKGGNRATARHRVEREGRRTSVDLGHSRIW